MLTTIPPINVSYCYALGQVSGDYRAGGLIGQTTNHHGSTNVYDCYAAGDVSGITEKIGGLIGYSYRGYEGSINILRCAAWGLVTGNTEVGGLIGLREYGGTYVISSYWDVNTSGQLTSDGGKGLITSQMQTQSSLTGWNFVKVWKICEGTNYPKLQWQIPTTGDFGCPDGVDFADYSVLANQWQLEKLEMDINYDGQIDFTDWADFANNWDGDYYQLALFLDCWLKRSATHADIAPDGGDDIVDWKDLILLCENWLGE